jgi:two-component system cell cycle sensor histidine kinase/response regulator CckA
MSDLLHTANSSPKLSTDGFQRLFENAPVAMLLEDAEGYLQEANPAACTLFGEARKDLVGKHASETIPPRMEPGPVGETPRLSSLRMADGNELAVSVLSTPIALGLDEGYLISIWEEKGSQESRAEESSNESPDALAISKKASCRIADLLNNSLTSIQGFVSLAQENLERGIAQSEHLSQIAEAAERGAGLARQLLLFGQPEFTDAIEVDCREFLEEFEANLREQGAAEIDLNSDHEQPLPPISASPDSLREILSQVLDNSNRATGGSGSVSITSSLRGGADDSNEEQSTDMSSGDYVSIAIVDDGPGMSSEVAASAFEPFFSSPQNSRSRGLGLSIVRQLMQQAGGHVELDSSPERGTRVSLLFPVHQTVEHDELQTEGTEIEIESIPEDHPEPEEAMSAADPIPTSPEPAPEKAAPAPATATKAPSSTTGGKETILVVEDEEMVRDLVKRSLSYLGYNVIDACNGEEGLEVGRQRSEEIDMVFTDIVMPRMSGPEMVANMTSEDLDLPVLYTTGFTDNKRLLDNGEIREGVNLLPKPYTTKVLAGRIREVLDAAVA